ASRVGGGQADVLPAAQGVAVQDGGAAGAGYGLVHDAIAVPVDLEGEDGAGRVTGGREGEGQRLPAGAGGRASDRGAGDHPDASLGVGQERVHRIGGGERLVADRLQRGAELPGAVAEGAIGGQHRLRIAAGEVDGAAVAGGQVAVGISGGEGEG